jgi:hypothetical protein
MTAVVAPPAAAPLPRPYRRSSSAPVRHPDGLRYLPVPDTEPPVEHGEPREQSDGWPGQGVLALMAPGSVDDDDGLFGPQPTPSRELPDPTRWGRQVAQLIVEVLAGHRPSSQLVRWTTDQVHRQVRQLVRPLASTRLGTRQSAPVASRLPVVGGLRVSEPEDGVAEVAAVVHRRHRVQAMALRLEGRDGRWVVTVLECG